MSDSSPVAAGDATAIGRTRSGADERTKKTILAAGGVLGAVAAASCCIVPLALFSLGISGVWIGNLAALTPYQPVIVSITAGFLGYGYYLVYGDRSRCVSLCRAGVTRCLRRGEKCL
jgi:mercuric ion transport protein